MDSIENKLFGHFFWTAAKIGLIFGILHLIWSSLFGVIYSILFNSISLIPDIDNFFLVVFGVTFWFPLLVGLVGVHYFAKNKKIGLSDSVMSGTFSTFFMLLRSFYFILS